MFKGVTKTEYTIDEDTLSEVIEFYLREKNEVSGNDKIQTKIVSGTRCVGIGMMERDEPYTEIKVVVEKEG